MIAITTSNSISVNAWFDLKTALPEIVTALCGSFSDAWVLLLETAAHSLLKTLDLVFELIWGTLKSNTWHPDPTSGFTF
jgi:hypothetical protein